MAVIALLLRSLSITRAVLLQLCTNGRFDSGFRVFTRCATAEWRREGEMAYLLELIGGIVVVQDALYQEIEREDEHIVWRSERVGFGQYSVNFSELKCVKRERRRFVMVALAAPTG
jgi:hypothetical protein